MTGVRVAVGSDADIISARQQGRELAVRIGFTASELALIATAISELARNVLTYAGRGEIVVEAVNTGARRGIVLVARDEGPGIANVEQAMQDGFSTGGGLGLGLPGVGRLMDELEVVSAPGQGTTVTARRWLRSERNA